MITITSLNNLFLQANKLRPLVPLLGLPGYLMVSARRWLAHDATLSQGFSAQVYFILPRVPE